MISSPTRFSRWSSWREVDAHDAGAGGHVAGVAPVDGLRPRLRAPGGAVPASAAAGRGAAVRGAGGAAYGRAAGDEQRVEQPPLSVPRSRTSAPSRPALLDRVAQRGGAREQAVEDLGAEGERAVARRGRRRPPAGGRSP